jgi:uncharacterized protein YkwD
MSRRTSAKRAFVSAVFVTLAGVLSCGGQPAANGSGATSPPPTASGSAASASGASAAPTPSAAPVSVTRPKGKLTVGDARRYMVTLINRDRATMGLAPVSLDEGAPTRAGDRHSRDMASHSFLGHWGTDGSIPEQRYTESGGTDMVFENAFCITDEKPRELDPALAIDPADIERAEDMFFNEVPPNDGHRKNILKKNHSRVGIGLALAKPIGNEILVPCLTHEFVDVYGTYAPIPASVTAGQKIHVTGTFSAAVSPGAVGYSRLDDPKPIPVAEANRRRAIAQKSADVLYWPRGYVSDVYLDLNGSAFSIDVAFPKPGFYELSVWAKFPGEKDFATISLRTVVVK